MDRDVETALESSPTPMREVALRACNTVLAIFPGAVVTVQTQNPSFGTTIGFGTAAGYKGLRFTVTPQRTHVTLGIAHGAGLADPSGLLEGTGKVHRHAKLRRVEDLDRAELRQLLASAMTPVR